MVNIDNIEAAVKKLRQINWLYKEVIKVTNSSTSAMLEKASNDDIADQESGQQVVDRVWHWPVQTALCPRTSTADASRCYVFPESVSHRIYGEFHPLYIGMPRTLHNK